MGLGIIFDSMALDFNERVLIGLFDDPLTISGRCATQLGIIGRLVALGCVEKIITDGRIDLISMM